MSYLFSNMKEREEIMLKIAGLSTIAGSIGSFLIGDFTLFMYILLAMTALDILTGIAKGIYDKRLRSRKMSQGMIRKFMQWVVIIMANFIDHIMFQSLPVAKTSAVLFYIGMEGISVLENLALMDVKIPKFIAKYLEVIKDKGENPELPQEKKVDEIKVVVDDQEIKLKTKDEDEDIPM